MANRESQNRIRMLPPIGEPDPERLAPLVREYVKKNSDPLSELNIGATATAAAELEQALIERK